MKKLLCVKPLPTAPHFQCRSLPAELFPSYFPTCPFTLMHILCLGYRLRSLWHQFLGTIALMEFVLKNPCQQLCSFKVSLPANEAMPCMSHGPRFGNFGRSWAHSFSEQSCWWNLSWKTRANSSAFLVLLPANEAMHVPSLNVCKPLEKSLRQQDGPGTLFKLLGY